MDNQHVKVTTAMEVVIMWRRLLVTLCCAIAALANSSFDLDNDSSFDLPYKFISEVICNDISQNDLTSIILYGDNFPGEMFSRLMEMPVNILRLTDEGHEPKAPATCISTPLPSLVVLRARDLGQFSRALLVLTRLNDWNPHAKVIVHLECGVTDVDMSRIFFAFWWHTVPNVIVIQVRDLPRSDTIVISRYTPFAYDGFHLAFNYGCWSDKGFGQIRGDVVKRTTCQLGCEVTSQPLKSMNLPTCISFEHLFVKFDQSVNDLELFPDRARDLKGRPMITFMNTVPPFLVINKDKTGLDFISGRDPSIWKSIAKLLNFTLNFQREEMIQNFSYNTAVRKVIEMSNRKLEICVFPVFRLIPPPLHIEMSYNYESSGLCYVTRRSELLSFLISIQAELLLIFFTAYFMVVATFTAIIFTQNGSISWDGFARGWSYTTNMFLFMPLHWLPRKWFLRLSIGVIFWGAFFLNYTTQSVLTSSLAAKKRPDNMNTFTDVADSGLLVYGLDSPDVMLPDTDEIFRKINNNFRPIPDFMKCINWLRKGRHVICIVECSTANYLTMNAVDDRGSTFLHVLADRIHKKFLCFIVPKYSPMLKHIDNFLMTFEQSGLIIKWRNTHFEKPQVDELEVKALSIKDVGNVFIVFGFNMIVCVVIFFGELLRCGIFCPNSIFCSNSG